MKESGSRYRLLGIRSLIVWRERLSRAGISFGRAVAQPSFPVALKYSPSLTASSHSLAVSAPGTSTARWESQLFGAAPCQCFTPRRNIHHIARMQFLRRLAFLLIKAASGNADENLPTDTLCVMNMPVVAATRFKSHVINADLRGGQWRQITLPDKVPGKSVVGCADREHHLTLMLGSRIGDSVLLCPNFFCHAERRPRLGPEKATAYPVTIFSLHFFFSNSSVLTLASRFNDRVERSRLIKFHLLCQYS